MVNYRQLLEAVYSYRVELDEELTQQQKDEITARTKARGLHRDQEKPAKTSSAPSKWGTYSNETRKHLVSALAHHKRSGGETDHPAHDKMIHSLDKAMASHQKSKRAADEPDMSHPQHQHLSHALTTHMRDHGETDGPNHHKTLGSMDHAAN